MTTYADVRRKKPAERHLTVTVDPATGETMQLRFRAVGRKRWQKLIEDHPATDAQQQQYAEQQLRAGAAPSKLDRLRFDPDTFTPAAMAACLVDPVVTVEEATEWWNGDSDDDGENWSEDELIKIHVACIAVNETSGTAEWGKGSAATPASGTSSPPATTTASATANGKAGPKTTRTKRSRT